MLPPGALEEKKQTPKQVILYECKHKPNKNQLHVNQHPAISQSGEGAEGELLVPYGNEPFGGPERETKTIERCDRPYQQSSVIAEQHAYSYHEGGHSNQNLWCTKKSHMPLWLPTIFSDD